MPEAGAAVARGRRVALLGAAASGVLYFLGYLGYGIWPCLFVFLVPLWAALESSERVGSAFGVGLAFGLVAYAGGFLWLWYLVGPFLDGNRLVGAVLWVLYGLWFALGFAVYAALVHALRRRGWSRAMAAIPPFVAVEWLQPQLFPLYVGGGLVAAPALVQTADLGGPLLLGALVAGANLTALETWLWWRGRRPTPRGIWLATVAVAGAALGYGALRTRALERTMADAPALRVGVVQANLGIPEKEASSPITHRRHLEETRALLAGGDVDLVVWPETAYVQALRRPLPISGRPVLEDLRVPLLFGAGSVMEEGGRRRKTNSAFLVDAEGMIRDAYDKNLLIPLAEFVPFASLVPAVGAWLPHVGEFSAATETPPLRLGPWRLATPICYEAIRPEFVRRMVETSDPHLLVTLANDAWFGDSQEPWLHLGLTRLRAVEHRRFLVRATNSGVSAIVDPMGRIVAATPLLARDTLRATVRLLDGRTPYARLGDWPGWVAAALVALGLARRRTRPAAVRR